MKTRTRLPRRSVMSRFLSASVSTENAGTGSPITTLDAAQAVPEPVAASNASVRSKLRLSRLICSPPSENQNILAAAVIELRSQLKAVGLDFSGEPVAIAPVVRAALGLIALDHD